MNKNTNQGKDEEQLPKVMHARTVTGTGGGPEKTIINSPKFLASLGYEAECLFLRPKGDPGFDVLRERAKNASAPLIEIDDDGKFSIKMVKEVIRCVRERDVKIWHAHDYKSNLLGIIVNRFHPMRLITTAHGWVNFDGLTPLYYWLDKKLFLPRYESVICVSSTVMEQATAGGTPKSKCILIDNAIDHEQFSRQLSISEAKLKFHDMTGNSLLVGSIGRLAPEKGFDLLINAVAKLIKNGLDAYLKIAGEGPEKSNLEKQIDSLGMRDRIQLMGFQSDTRSFYESLDMFVLSSHREGLPNVVLEAMAVGTPVIATNIDGVPKIIHDGINGVLIPPNDEITLARQIQVLANNASLRCKLSHEGQQTIQQHWSFKNRIKTITALYSKTESRKASELFPNSFKATKDRN